MIAIWIFFFGLVISSKLDFVLFFDFDIKEKQNSNIIKGINHSTNSVKLYKQWGIVDSVKLIILYFMTGNNE